MADYLFWDNTKKTMLVLKLSLLLWPGVYVTLVYLPIRYFIAVGWCSLFIYMSDFGSRFCYAVFKTIQMRVEDYQIALGSSLQVAEEESAKPSPVSMTKFK